MSRGAWVLDLRRVCAVRLCVLVSCGHVMKEGGGGGVLWVSAISALVLTTVAFGPCGVLCPAGIDRLYIQSFPDFEI